MVRAFRTLTVLLGVAVSAACTIKDSKTPPLVGPSELGTSISLQASPDVLTQDGASQSQVVALVRDAGGQPVRNLTLRVEITQGGSIADYGALSPGRNITTGSDGRAMVTYTAPPAPLQSVDTGYNIINLLVTPLGTDYSNATPRSVAIRLVPPGVIVPPSNISAGFSVSAESVPEMGSVVVSASCASADSVDCARGAVSRYAWNFGDGGSATGVSASHLYSSAGVYLITLTVYDALDRGASASKAVTVTALAAPKADFVFSPAAPVHGVLMYFNAAASTAAAGRTIVSYEWSWGDGKESEDSRPVEDHIYDLPGTYTVTLTVVDDMGRRHSISKPVAVI